MKRTIVYFIIVFGAALAFAACKGEKGETGPTGPVGESRTFTTVINVAAPDWQVGGPKLVYYDLRTPIITKNAIDSGAVLLYYELVDGGWALLPNGFIGKNYQPYYINYFYDSSLVEIIMDSPTLTSTDLRVLKLFKLVVIEGFPPLTNIDLENYEAVRRALDLRD